MVISRSSYPSLGRFGGHWTGDVFSKWEDLYYTIPGILVIFFKLLLSSICILRNILHHVCFSH